MMQGGGGGGGSERNETCCRASARNKFGAEAQAMGCKHLHMRVVHVDRIFLLRHKSSAIQCTRRKQQ
jgi:hypothetical protein